MTKKVIKILADVDKYFFKKYFQITAPDGIFARYATGEHCFWLTWPLQYTGICIKARIYREN